ncbi:hypothetical protein [Candidatus Phaeomarinobacter ectocarpi]|uniref:hypothetical protein n=1 Tax=Candidatus Phaeomarinibacter ectocarpi TaxID=1458461 RepID=UPI0005C61A0A|nr:hypothetical protein [Candidatus Phaeomarinobacter ectocarpi]
MGENDIVTQWWINRRSTIFDLQEPLQFSAAETRIALVILVPFILAAFVYLGVTVTAALAGSNLDAAGVFLGVCAVFAAFCAIAIDRHRITVRTAAEAKVVRLGLGPELIEQMLVFTRACTRAESNSESASRHGSPSVFVHSAYSYLQLEAPSDRAYRSILPLIGSLPERDVDRVTTCVSDRMRFEQEGFQGRWLDTVEICNVLTSAASAAAVSTLRAGEALADEFDFEQGCMRALQIIRDAELEMELQMGTRHVHECIETALAGIARRRSSWAEDVVARYVEANS